MKENFEFGNTETDTASSWPPEEQLPGFRDFAIDFHQVCGPSVDSYSVL